MKERKASLKEYFSALVDYIKKPKTVFDLKDRLKILVLLLALIIILQRVVENISC